VNKKTVQDNEMSIEQDDKAKSISIQDATRMLIGAKGYEKVTIQDIADSANVSIGLIHKYFPDGEFDILKGINHQYTDELLMIKQPVNVDFNDFPGYMKTIIKNLQKLNKDNSSLVKVLTIAASNDGEIIDEVKKMDFKDYKAAADFFARFNNVKIGSKDPLELLMYWGIMVKGTILLNMIYPVPFTNEEALTDLMVDLSLTIWGYQKTP
jgi:AcrR family transcriptional regulator